MQDLVLTSIPLDTILQAINDNTERIVKSVIKEALQAERQLPFQDKEYLTGKEVDELLSITPPTRYDWEKKGLFSRYKMNDRTRYKRSEILAAFQKMK